MSNNIQHAYEAIRKFNLIAGALTHSNHEQTLNGVALQIELLKEEVGETEDAFTEQDSTELLKEACDAFVVAAGLLQRLEAAGFNVEKALQRVCDNNLTKFPRKHDPEIQPEGSEVVETPHGHVAYKRELDGKVLKPKNYVPVNLSGCVVEGLFGDSRLGEIE